MGKSAVATPLYLSVAWIMLISYQLFTQKAVDSFVYTIDAIWPTIGGWMVAHMDVIVFMHAFAWVFVLSSLIPSVILGKERSVLIQFFVCLTLAFVAISFMEILSFISSIPILPRLEFSEEKVFEMVIWLKNPWIASLYLSAPYLLMLSVDLRERSKKPRIGFMNYEPELSFNEESITLDKPYAARVTTEDELAGYLKRGWKIVMELSEKRYLIKKQYRR